MDEYFFSNVGFVTESIDATKKIVGSIEDDVRDVRTMIQQRLQRRIDLEELVALQQTENDILKSKINLLEIESTKLHESYHEKIQAIEEEFGDRLLVSQAEMDRVLVEHRSIKMERDNILAKAKELDTYCTRVENELVELKSSHETTLQKLNHYESERQEVEQYVNRVIQENEQHRQENFILRQHLESAQSMILQLETWKQSILIRQDSPTRASPKVIQRLDNRIMYDHDQHQSPLLVEPIRSLEESQYSDQKNPYRDTAAVSSGSHYFSLYHESHIDDDRSDTQLHSPVTQPSPSSTPVTISPPVTNIGDNNGLSDQITNPFSVDTPSQQLVSSHILHPQSLNGSGYGDFSNSVQSAGMFDLRDPDEYYDGSDVQLDDLLNFKV